MVGGVDASGQALRTITALVLNGGRSVSAGRLPAPISDAAIVVLGGHVWLFGGSRGGAVEDILLASIPAS